MSNDDLVSRIHQQAQGGHDTEVLQAVTQFRAWRDAAYRLLSQTRGNLPAIIASSEQMLEPLSIRYVREVGKGRKRTRVVEIEPTAGWKLRNWNDENGPYHSPREGCDYLLYDGRLLRAIMDRYSADTPQGDLLADSEFLKMLPQERTAHLPSPRLAVGTIGLLFARAGLAEPQLPPAPEYYIQSFKYLTRDEWGQLRSQEIQ